MSIRQAASTSTASRERSAGFSLIELMVALAVGAILTGIGVSSYKYVTNSNRVSTEVNSLLGDLMIARSEAIRQGVNVVVCPVSFSGTTPSCNAVSTWQGGWFIFADTNGNGAYDSGEQVIRVQNAWTSTDTFSASDSAQSLTFNREGFATGLVSLTSHAYITITLHTTPTNDQWTRCLQVGVYGALTTERKGTGACT
jgi:type IV fimbrial biogenesis protein FimT